MVGQHYSLKTPGHLLEDEDEDDGYRSLRKQNNYI